MPKRNKLVLDAYDAVSALCQEHINSLNKWKLIDCDPRQLAQLLGKKKAYEEVLNFCQQKKETC